MFNQGIEFNVYSLNAGNETRSDDGKEVEHEQSPKQRSEMNEFLNVDETKSAGEETADMPDTQGPQQEASQVQKGGQPQSRPKPEEVQYNMSLAHRLSEYDPYRVDVDVSSESEQRDEEEQSQEYDRDVDQSGAQDEELSQLEVQ